ncbi:AlpA family phage regulatory protein [Azoarcus communis]|nr:AlpA family phage regulatory protein [Parazoarcus communis]
MAEGIDWDGSARQQAWRKEAASAARAAVTGIRNESNLAGENVGGDTPDSVVGAGVDGADQGSSDGGGDADPEPERRPLARCTSPADVSSKRCAPLPAALIQFSNLPDDAFVRLPIVCALFARSAPTVWRHVKSGQIPSPRKLSDRITAWRVGDLRAALHAIAQ